MGKRLKSSGLSFLITGVMLSVLGIIALISQLPFIFPSLGPTAFLLATNPLAKISSPKNIILGHLIGVLCGYFALTIFGLTDSPSIFISGISPQFIGAAIISIALTSLFMVLFSVEHPPAGATTLIVSLGVMNTPVSLVILMISVIILCVMGKIINNLLGIKYPVWS